MHSQIENELRILISDGEALVPRGGSLGSGFNSTEQDAYLQWRGYVIHVLSQQKELFAHLISDILSDGKGKNFYASSVKRILGNVKAARDIIISQANSPVQGSQQTGIETMTDRKKIFIIHGRNLKAFNSMKLFLRAIGLDTWDFDTLVAEEGGSPFIGDIVSKAMQTSAAIIVLFTPDERSALMPEFVRDSDSVEDKERLQARPNVIFEAGMALGMDPKRTILVTLGSDVKLFSDVNGRHILRLTNQTAKRQALIKRLEALGCPVKYDTDWHSTDTAGNFETIA